MFQIILTKIRVGLLLFIDNTIDMFLVTNDLLDDAEMGETIKEFLKFALDKDK